MKTWQKILIITFITVAIGGIYLLTVWRHRQNPGVAGRQAPEQHLSADDVAVVRMEFQQHFDDVKQLGDNGGHAAKMPRTSPAAESFAETFHRDPGGRTGSVHLFG